MNIIKSLILSVFLLGLNQIAFAAPPTLLFSDFTDGATSGWNGSTSQGASVTVWGTGLGAVDPGSSITVCGQTLASSTTVEWGATTNPQTARGLQRVTFYLNSSMTLGPGTIQITTVNGQTVSVPFYCRALGTNHIYYISNNGGNDSYDGLAPAFVSGTHGPWLTPGHVRAMKAGDSTYFRGTGTAYTAPDTWNGNTNNGVMFNFWYAEVRGQGTANNSIGMSSYPGEVALLGNGTGVDGWNQYDPNSTGALNSPLDTVNYWTISKMKWNMPDCAVCSGSGVSPGNVANDHNRWVGNEMQTSTNTGISGSVFRVLGGAGNKLGTTNLTLYGNYLHDAGGLSYLQVYNLYFGAAGYLTNTDVGWNEVAYSHGGRGVQIYCHSTSDHIENFNFHDNFVHDNAYTGVIFGGGDGNAGVAVAASQYYNCTGNMYVWNNIIAHNGWDQYRKNTPTYPGVFICNNGGTIQWHCNWGQSTAGTGRYFWNNTYYNNGLGNVEISDSGNSTYGTLTIQNDINVAVAGNAGHYLMDNQNPGGPVCSASCANWMNNLYFGPNGVNELTPFPDITTALFNTNPQFVAAIPTLWSDFNLQATSLAIGKGTGPNSRVTTDFMGYSRPIPPTIGAFEYNTGSVNTGGTVPTTPSLITITP